MAISNDLQAAQDEYGSSASPYASLSDYLTQRPAYDRGAREAPPAPSMRTLEAIMPDTDQLLAEQYEKIMAEQRAAEEASTAARQSEIDSLQELLRQELSTSEDAALGQRSELTKALEGQIEDMRRGLDAETLDLRQAGLDERAALARQIEEGDRLVSEAQTSAIGDLEDRQGSLVGDLKKRIGSLSTDLSDINSVIAQNYSELANIQETSSTATGEQIAGINQELESLSGTQSEIDTLNQQLESLYADVESGNVDQSEVLRGEVSDLISGLEGKIGGIQENLGALPIDQIQTELTSINAQTAAFQEAVNAASRERTDLASRIEALQAAGLTQDDLSGLSQSIAGQRQTDISGAISPIQEQIEALRGQIPGEVDVDALRKSIIDEINAQTPAPGGGTGGGAGGEGGAGNTNVDGFSGTPYENFMGGFVPGAGQTYDAGMDYGPSASEAAGFNPAGGGSMGGGNQSIYGQGGSASADFYGNAPVGSMGGGNQSIVDNSGYLDFYDQQTLNPVSPVKTGNMPGGGVGSGYVKTGAPAYSQSGFLAGEIPPDGSFSGPFQVTQAPALQAAPKFSSTGSRRRR
jgi:hypothetical protein